MPSVRRSTPSSGSRQRAAGVSVIVREVDGGFPRIGPLDDDAAQNPRVGGGAWLTMRS